MAIGTPRCCGTVYYLYTKVNFTSTAGSTEKIHITIVNKNICYFQLRNWNCWKFICHKPLFLSLVIYVPLTSLKETDVPVYN